jgi:uncharacterized protein YyaL (SSP411 family)
LEVVVVGEPKDERTSELLTAAYQTPRGNKRVFEVPPTVIKNGELPPGLAATLPNLPLTDAPLALVCVGSSCLPPVHTPEGLRALLMGHAETGSVEV